MYCPNQHDKAGKNDRTFSRLNSCLQIEAVLLQNLLPPVIANKSLCNVCTKDLFAEVISATNKNAKNNHGLVKIENG